MKKNLALLLAILMAFSLSAFAEESMDLIQLFNVENSCENLLKNYDNIHIAVTQSYSNEDIVDQYIYYVDSSFGYTYLLEADDESAYIVVENGYYDWDPDGEQPSEYYMTIFFDDSDDESDRYYTWYEEDGWFYADGIIYELLKFEDRGETIYLEAEYSVTDDDGKQIIGTGTFVLDAETHAVLEGHIHNDETVYGFDRDHESIITYNVDTPEKALELLERANPDPENARTGTFIMNPGTDDEEIIQLSITRGDAFNPQPPEGYGIFLDAEGTQPWEADTDLNADITLYILPTAE